MSADGSEVVVLEPSWNAWNAQPSQQPQRSESRLLEHSAPVGM